MNGKQIKVLITSSILCLGMVAGFAFAQNNVKTMDGAVQQFSLEQTREGKSLVDLLYEKQDTTALRRNIILSFCDTMLKTREDENITDIERDVGTYRYDPRQSMFMYGLCVHMDEIGKGRTIAKKKYRYRNFKKVFGNVKYKAGPAQDVNTYWKQDEDLKDLLADLWGIPRQGLLDSESAYTPCNPASSMQNCRFSRFVPVIFNHIMNDYSNMKLASIYGYRASLKDNSEEEVLEAAIKEFNDSYFKDGTNPESPCNKNGVGYIHDKNLEGNTKHCLHPMTYKELEETIKSAERIMEKVQYFDVDVLFSLEEEAACDTINPKSSILRCSIGNRGDISVRSDWQSFYNLYLNELMWYNLFLDYYINTIQENNAYSPLTFGSLSYTFKQNEKEIQTLSYERAISQQATAQTMRMLSNLYTTYPVYIALRAYREDLLQYRGTIAKMFTPMDQMYYKFRNVQEAGEDL